MSTPARGRKMVDCMKFTKKVLDVIDKEDTGADSSSTDNCNVLQVVKLNVLNKGFDTEGVACLELENNRNGLVCQELKNINIPYQMVAVGL